MAELRAYKGVDMLDFGLPRDLIEQISKRLAFMEVGDGRHWYLYGDYKDPGDDWRGEIKRIEVFDEIGDLALDIRGVTLKTSYVPVGATTAFAIRSALKGDDTVMGSNAADRLAGFSGDDVMLGRAGRDAIYGNDGADVLRGGRGADHLRGGSGADRLYGESGADVLRGDEGSDVFVFGARGGSDVIVDFTDGRDRILIEDGASRFRDVRIEQDGADTNVFFAKTTIALLDTRSGELGASDFIFDS